jgi:hypothetical protein
MALIAQSRGIIEPLRALHPSTTFGLHFCEWMAFSCGLILAVVLISLYRERWPKSRLRSVSAVIAICLAGEFGGDCGVFILSGGSRAISEGEVAGIADHAVSLKRPSLDRPAILDQKNCGTSLVCSRSDRLAPTQHMEHVKVEPSVLSRSWRSIESKPVQILQMADSPAGPKIKLSAPLSGTFARDPE